MCHPNQDRVEREEEPAPADDQLQVCDLVPCLENRCREHVASYFEPCLV